MSQIKFFNRELSWIEFNARVLAEGCRKDVPLLERLTSMSFVTSNFSEFFKVRVASIKRNLRNNPLLVDESFNTPQSLLKKISLRCHELIAKQHEALETDILPSLRAQGICYVGAKDWNGEQKSYVESIFRHDIAPVLTPQRSDTPLFPRINGQHLHAAFLLEPMAGIHLRANPFAADPDSSYILALLQIPSNLDRIIPFPDENSSLDSSASAPKYFTVLDDVIASCSTGLFPGYRVTQSMLFKLERDADMAVDEDATSNYIQEMEKVLEKRESSNIIMMICTTSSPKLLQIIQEKLSLADEDVYPVNSFVDPSIFVQLKTLYGSKELCYPKWQHFYPCDLPEEDTYWNTLRQHDILLNVPYQSYEPVVKFIEDACADESVLAIKMTLYRTGSNSPIVKALEKAARAGKSVTVFVELKARFDEQRNISWAEQLEKAGAIVIYGVVKLKVHAKICLVVRRESDGLRRYVHLSTGNYNPATAASYQDFSIFSCRHEISTDASLFFNVISGYSALQPMHHLYMAPVTLKSRLFELIDREIQQSSPDSPGLIIAKMNSLCHKEVIEKLYQASCAGVKIMLNVRGICTLLPGLEGLSKNISVVSIVDRYLEHSRVFYFQNGGDEELYLSSADWMDRNLDRRIELMFPVADKEIFKNIKEELMYYFKDNTHSYNLLPDGKWKRKSVPAKEKTFSAQEALYKKYSRLEEVKKSTPKTEFTVRRNG